MKKENMRKVIYWLIAVTILTLTACSNEDNNTSQGGTAQIIGRWTADVTGATETLWGDGKALNDMAFGSYCSKISP